MRVTDFKSCVSARTAMLAVNKQGSEWDVGHDKRQGEGVGVIAIGAIQRLLDYIWLSAHIKRRGAHN